MTNINDLLNAAKGWADLAGKKANEAVEVSKLQINNVKINGDLQKAYEKLGAFVYKMHKEDDSNEELILMCISEIDDLMEQLEDNEKKINEARHKVKCPSCEAVNELDAIYCIKCGAKIETVAETSEYVEVPVEEVEPVAEEPCCCGCEEAPAEEPCCCEEKPCDCE